MQKIEVLSIDQLASHDGHNLRIDYYGPASGPFWAAAITCVDCDETVFGIENDEVKMKYAR